MTKKQQKEKNNKNRILIPFNTGTITHKNPKYDKKTARRNAKNLERGDVE